MMWLLWELWWRRLHMRRITRLLHNGWWDYKSTNKWLLLLLLIAVITTWCWYGWSHHTIILWRSHHLMLLLLLLWWEIAVVAMLMIRRWWWFWGISRCHWWFNDGCTGGLSMFNNWIWTSLFHSTRGSSTAHFPITARDNWYSSWSLRVMNAAAAGIMRRWYHRCSVAVVAMINLVHVKRRWTHTMCTLWSREMTDISHHNSFDSAVTCFYHWRWILFRDRCGTNEGYSQCQHARVPLETYDKSLTSIVGWVRRERLLEWRRVHKEWEKTREEPPLKSDSSTP